MSAGPPLDRLDRSIRSLFVAATLVALTASLDACASKPPGQAASKDSPSKSSVTTAPSDLRDWVGHWRGGHASSLRIMPGRSAGRYKLTLRSANGITRRYPATAAGNRLIFNRGGRTLAIRAGRGNETNEPELADLTECVIVVPGRQGYCRRRNTADALPLARGAYVTVKARCRTAQPADMLYFDGRALARFGQNACRATVVSQKGIIFHLSDGCAASPDNAQTRSNETVAVPDSHHLSLQAADRATRLYRYCANGLLPPRLMFKPSATAPK